jgi:hypothetical protein
VKAECAKLGVVEKVGCVWNACACARVMWWWGVHGIAAPALHRDARAHGWERERD